MEIRAPSPQSNPRAQVGPEPPTGFEGAGPTGSPFSLPIRPAQSRAGNSKFDKLSCVARGRPVPRFQQRNGEVWPQAFERECIVPTSTFSKQVSATGAGACSTIFRGRNLILLVTANAR